MINNTKVNEFDLICLKVEPGPPSHSFTCTIECYVTY